MAGSGVTTRPRRERSSPVSATRRAKSERNATSPCWRAESPYWTGESELRTETPLKPGGWQFLAATFEAGELILYGDGVRLTSGRLKLKAAAPFMHLAPVPALWPDAAHFAGRIADFTLLSRALTPEEVRRLGVQTRNFDRIAFEAASKSWPVQTKGQEGLRAPQEPATLPASSANRRHPPNRRGQSRVPLPTTSPCSPRAATANGRSPAGGE